MSISLAVKALTFPGSAVIAGKSADGTSAVCAFFICGINNADRARVFEEDADGVSIKPFGGTPSPELCNRPVRIGANTVEITNEALNTPHISAFISTEGGELSVKMEIQKKTASASMKQVFEYSSVAAGKGFMLTALEGSEYPFSAHSGEPTEVAVEGSIFDVVADIWENLRPETRVSLWVISRDLTTGRSMSRIINRNR